MYETSIIQDLSGIVGFRESTISAYQILDSANKSSSSGLYVNDEFPLCSVKNIKETILDKSIANSDFNTLLKNWQKQSIVSIMDDVFKNDDVVENYPLYNYENTYDSTITNSSKFVGFQIDVAKDKEIAAIINSIIGRFDGDVDLTIYLFHSSQYESINTFDLSATSYNDVELTVNEILSYYSYKGGTYYLGYYQDDLGSVKAIEKNHDLADLRSRYLMMSVRPIEVSNVTGTNLFDVDKVDYSSESWGLNLDLSTVRDYTDIIVKNKNRFARAIVLKLAAYILRQISQSQRENRDKRLSQQAYFELKGNQTGDEMPFSLGVERELDREIKKLRKTFINEEKIVSLCLK